MPNSAIFVPSFISLNSLAILHFLLEISITFPPFIIILVKGGIVIPDLSQVWIYVLLMALLYGLANISVFKSLQLTDASQFGVIFQSKNLFAIIGTSLIFNEILTSKQWIGAILLLIGVVIVSLGKTKFKLNKGVVLAMIAGLLFGAANVNDRFLVSYFDPYTYVVIGFLFPAVFISILYLQESLFLSSTSLCSPFCSP